MSDGELDERTRFLLGLCFCRHCRTAAEAEGVDVALVRQWVAGEVHRALDSGDALSDRPAEREWAWEVCDGELGRFLEVRIESVTRFAELAQEASASSGVQDVAVIDPSGAMLGYSTGDPNTAERAVDIGWPRASRWTVWAQS